MDVVTPARNRGIPEAFTGEKGCSIRDTLVGLNLGESFPSTMALDLEGP
jgi:hypothetical protein